MVRLVGLAVLLALLAKYTNYAHPQPGAAREIARGLKQNAPRLAGRFVARQVTKRRSGPRRSHRPPVDQPERSSWSSCSTPAGFVVVVVPSMAGCVVVVGGGAVVLVVGLPRVVVVGAGRRRGFGDRGGPRAATTTSTSPGTGNTASVGGAGTSSAGWRKRSLAETAEVERVGRRHRQPADGDVGQAGPHEVAEDGGREAAAGHRPVVHVGHRALRVVAHPHGGGHLGDVADEPGVDVVLGRCPSCRPPGGRGRPPARCPRRRPAAGHR